MAGCDKAGRNKKSNSNVTYISTKRKEINATKKRASKKAFDERKAGETVQFERGHQRRIRRAHWLSSTPMNASGKPAISFQEYEANLKKSRKAPEYKSALKAALLKIK